jgi:hypothetical protein
MKKIIIRIVTVLILLVIVGLVVLFFSLNSIVKKGVETVGPKLTKVDVKLGSADISPFSGSGKLSKLFVGNPADFKTPYAMQMDSIKVAVEIGSVTKDTIVINEIDIESPEIQFDGGLSGNNLSKIQDNLSSGDAKNAAPASSSSGTEKQKKFIVKDFVLRGAKVHLNVTVPAVNIPMSATVPIPDIHLQNIGQDSGGVTAAELGQQVMKPLYDSVYKAAADLASGAVKNVENLGKGAVSQVTSNIPGGIGDLFKKK